VSDRRAATQWGLEQAEGDLAAMTRRFGKATLVRL